MVWCLAFVSFYSLKACLPAFLLFSPKSMLAELNQAAVQTVNPSDGFTNNVEKCHTHLEGESLT